MSALLPALLVNWLFPAALALAISSDLIGRIIPNAVVALLAMGFALLCLTAAVPDIPARLLAAFAVLGIGFTLFAQDIIGAGDAKLAGALALWLDPAQLPAFALVCAAIGLILVVIATWNQHRATGRFPSLPYGVALAGAGLLLFPQSGLMAALA